MAFKLKPIKKRSDEDLVPLIADGCTEAFNEFYGRYSQRLLLYFHRMLGDENRAQDFLQDISITLIHKSHTFRREGKFSTWIFTIASNMCKNEFRKTKRISHQDHETLDQHVSTESGISEQVEQNQLLEQIQHVLSQMTSDKKEAFLLRFQEGLSLKEISEIVRCPVGTVKSRLFHTTRELSEKLSAYREKDGNTQ